jgi:hypothetical protein
MVIVDLLPDCGEHESLNRPMDQQSKISNQQRIDNQ